MEIESFEREIIRELFKCQDWLDLYTLHQELLLSPAQVAYTLSELEAKGYSESEGTNARLTAEGRRWVLRSRRELFLDVRRPWAKSKLVKEATLEASQPYLPRLGSIDRHYFQKK
jgi:hypothetical protein